MKKGKNAPHLSKVFLRMLVLYLYLPILIIALIRVFVSGYISQQNAEYYQRQEIKSVLYIMDEHIKQGETAIEAISKIAELNNEKAMPIFVGTVCKNYGYFSDIYFLNNDNKISRIVPSNSHNINYSMSNSLNVKNILARKKNISHPFIAISKENKEVYLIKNIADGRTIIGRLNLDLFKKDIQYIMGKSYNDGIIIVDKAGVILRQPHIESFRGTISASEIKLLNTELYKNNKTKYSYNKNGLIINAAPMKKTGWIIVDQIQRGLVFRYNILEIIIIVVLSLIIFMVLLFIFHKKLQEYVVSPLNKLVQKTHALIINDVNEGNSFSDIPAYFFELNKLCLDFEHINNTLKLRKIVIQENEKRYRGLVDRLSIGIFSATLNGEILEVNPKILSIFGYDKSEDFLNNNIIDFLRKVSLYDSEGQLKKECIHNLNNFETQIVGPDKIPIWIQISTHKVYDGEVQQEFFEGTIKDISYRKHADAKIREQKELIYRAEKERCEELEKALIMKDEFISLISHEFKTPLNVIYSAIQLIECAYFDRVPKRVQELVGNIKQNTFRQLRLVNNLLDITRLNSGQVKLNMRNIDIVFIARAITKSVELYANQKNIRIFFESNLKSKIISMDEEKFERILLNIISNAIKFTKSEGKISVTVSENKKLNFIQISVTDTGIGIPKDKQDLIFERFGQVDSNLSRQAEGTGIGLSLVKLYVDVLGGTIGLESELNVGTTFIVTLPAEIAEENDMLENFLDVDDRLLNEIKVQFSDIYF